MSIVSSLGGGILGSGAANDAATVESQGAKQAQNLEYQNQQNALGSQQTALGNVTAAQQPYQTVGSTASNNLVNILNESFQAPTLAEAENTPGYQFNLEQGTRAIDQNAAANGTLLTGNTGTALEKYGQNLARTTYQQDYNNALSTYGANTNTALQGTQLGENSTGQLTNANLGIAGMATNTDLTGGQQQAQQINNAAAARASGYLGSANAWSGAAGGMAGGLAGGLGNLDTTGGSSMLEQAANFFL